MTSPVIPLCKKNYGMIAFNIHNDINYITNYNIDELLCINHSGIITHLINYYIINNKFEEIENKIMFSIMDRDYYNIIKYYYENNKQKSIDIFINKILQNPDTIICQKNIDFIIQNKLFSLLPYLDGFYANTSFNGSDFIAVKKYLDVLHSQRYIKKYRGKHYKQFYTFLTQSNYDYIVDGCNVLLHETGKINNNSLNNIILINGKFKNSIFIFYETYLYKIPTLKETLETNNIRYFITPKYICDDNFVIYAFLHNTKSHIITNDKYSEHINNLESNKNKYIQLCHKFKEQSINYNIQKNIYNTINSSNCIHVINDNIYVPSNNGLYLVI